VNVRHINPMPGPSCRGRYQAINVRSFIGLVTLLSSMMNHWSVLFRDRALYRRYKQ
jgi:hypothetical protein